MTYVCFFSLHFVLTKFVFSFAVYTLQTAINLFIDLTVDVSAPSTISFIMIPFHLSQIPY